MKSKGLGPLESILSSVSNTKKGQGSFLLLNKQKHIWKIHNISDFMVFFKTYGSILFGHVLLSLSFAGAALAQRHLPLPFPPQPSLTL